MTLTINNPDTRNVRDHFKYMENELIKGDLDSRRRGFSSLVWNLGMDYNCSSVIRSNNVFLGKCVYLYGKKRFDRRGCVGSHNYETLKHVKQIEDINDLPKDTVWVGVENVPEAKNIGTFEWPRDKHVLMCFGSEGDGLPKEVLDRCEHVIYIPMGGSVRSMNVASAASIAMFSYCLQTGVLNDY
jgi:tRNA G18 (ribose-2'-O)-methylase SpoU